MKKIVLFLILFSLAFVSAISDEEAGTTLKEVAGAVGEKVGDIGRNTNLYAEALGTNLLKFQTFFMGVLEFLSLGFLDAAEDMAFVTFLFFIVLFMVLYSIIGLVFDKFNFAIAFIVTLLAFIGMDEGVLKAVFLNYGAMGITLTVILPILILLAFTFRIYQRAYEGESDTSPFYAEMFNLAFLVFFGVFFIRHSASEEGVIAVMRLISGWALIGLGIGQTVFYKIAAGAFHGWKKDSDKEKKAFERIKKEAAKKLRDAELGI